MLIEPPQVLQIADTQVAFIHLNIARSKMREVMGPGIGELMALVKAQGAGPAGPWFTHHSTMHPGIYDFEISVPVTRPVSPAGRVEPGRWPAMRVARAVMRGSYENLAGAWPELDAWIHANGFKSAPDLYECYVVGPESSPDSSQWRTELSRRLLD